MLKTKTLNSKFIMFVIYLIIPIGICNILSLVVSKKIEFKYSKMLDNMMITNEIKHNIEDSLNDFNEYILNGDDHKRNSYNKKISLAKENLELLKNDSDNKSKYIIRDLENTLNSYIEDSTKTIYAYDNKEGYIFYYDDFIGSKNIANYSMEYASQLMQSYLEINSSAYKELNKKSTAIYTFLIVYLVIILSMCVVYSLLFVKNISKGLQGIIKTSNQVSNGQFEYYEDNKTDIYELDVLINTFNTMIKDIKNLISSLSEKLILEKKLKEEEMKNLKYENSLKEFELKIIQSQINPHFLFNTLNCINSIAIMENAKTTNKMIKSVSNILRYSLRCMNVNTSLNEEIDIVKDYIFIQKFRFEDRIKFDVNINMDISKIIVPGMTIQPLVENAFIHGIESKEEGGFINIDIKEEKGYCSIIIEDNGVGIKRDILGKIKDYKYEAKHTGHTTGLGINIVKKRLKCLYNNDNIFNIESEEGKGTRIYIKIPNINWGDKINGKDINC